MKILLANKFFFPKGGDAVVFFATAKLLENHGHQTMFFAMNDIQNVSSVYSPYFVSTIDLNNQGGIVNQLKTTGRIWYSFEAKKNIKRLLEKEKPDIAHLHNIYHQISPSILDVLKEYNIPTVMTLHDFKLTCPIYTHQVNHRICEKCGHKKYYHVVANRCTKGSLQKSLVNMIEMYLHHSILHSYDKVSLFVSPSKFLMLKTRELGFKGKIIYLPNFIELQEYQPEYSSIDNSLVYFGRLAVGKGIETFLDAIKGLNLPVKIIGEGPAKELLIKKTQSENITNITFLGYLQGPKLYNEIKKAMIIVVPSEWYENNPRSIIEAFALGKPVIGSDIGGIPELIKEGETGYLFPPGNSLALRDKIKLAWKEKDKLSELGRRARRFAETELNSEKHYAQLMEIYQSIIKAGKVIK